MYNKATTESSYAPISTKLSKYLESIRVPVRCKMKTHSGFDELLLIQCHKGFEQNKAKEIEQEETKKILETFEHDEKPELEIEDNEEKTKYKKLQNLMCIRQLFKFCVSVKLFAEDCFKGFSKQSTGKSFDSVFHLSKAFNALYKVSLIKKAKVTSGPDSESKKNQKQLTVLTKLCEELSKDKAKSEQEIKKLKEDTQRLQMELNRVLHVMTAEEKFTLKQMRELQEIAKDARVKLKQDLQAEQNKNVLVLEESRREDISTKEAVEIQNNRFPRRDEINKDIHEMHKKVEKRSRNRLSEDGWTSRLKSSSISIYRTVDPSKQLAKIHSAAKFFTALYGVKRVFQRTSTSSQESNSELPPAAQETPFTSEERDHSNEFGLSSTSENKTHLNGPEFKEEDIERKTESLIDEFLLSNNFDEAVESITELISSHTVHVFIEAAIHQVLEKSSQARHLLGQLLYHLLEKNIISFDQYLIGFKSVLEKMDGYSLDFPLAWDYFGEVLVPLIDHTGIPLELIREFLYMTGTIELGEVWRESGLQWANFLTSYSIILEFIKKHVNVSDLAEPNAVHILKTTAKEIALLTLLDQFYSNDEDVSDKENPSASWFTESSRDEESSTQSRLKILPFLIFFKVSVESIA
ncbi:eukaryotic translation initiation factor 4 gamma 3 [Caerostris extrusa]|uniref:Eukaryotic translation initiation factor 4 gamma 3 n=1 Tax=Caerostris extrusa TaxID=172846 RepID=A0AAV4U8L7_CAEEX|nr:eukaryotic translation initiation factor 4 gamma 3 [Caerostris extrusa]